MKFNPFRTVQKKPSLVTCSEYKYFDRMEDTWRVLQVVVFIGIAINTTIMVFIFTSGGNHYTALSSLFFLVIALWRINRQLKHCRRIIERYFEQQSEGGNEL